MATKVDMWCAVSGPSSGAEDCWTDGLFDCVALGVIGKTELGVGGYYFGHLTARQYCSGTDDQGNGMRALKEFLKTHPAGVVVIAAVNFQPEPDFTQPVDRMRPTSIESLVCTRVREYLSGGTYTLKNMWYLAEGSPSGGTVTFKPEAGTLHAAGPDAASNQNNVTTACARYNSWSLSAMVEEQRRRKALLPPEQPRSTCVIL